MSSDLLDVVNTIRATSGWTDFTAQDFLDAGERIYLLRQYFSLRKGLDFNQVRLPPRLAEAPQFEGVLAGSRNTLDWYAFRRHYFAGHGLDPNTGMPSIARMESLGIGHLAKD